MDKIVVLLLLTFVIGNAESFCRTPLLSNTEIRHNGRIVVGNQRIQAGQKITLACRPTFSKTGQAAELAFCQYDGSWLKLNNETGIVTSFGICEQAEDEKHRCGNSAFPGIEQQTNVESGQFPWMVRLIVHTQSRQISCGGTLINDEWILTAAQCVVGVGRIRSISVYLGRVNFSRFDEPNQQQRFVQSTNVYPHPRYNTRYRGDQMNFNVALIRLERPAILNQFVRSVCLPNDIVTMCRRGNWRSDGYPSVDGCSETFSAGWGNRPGGRFGPVLKRFNLTMYDDDTCPTHLCVGGSEICRVNPGNALMCKRAGRVHIVGVFSQPDTEDAQCRNPSHLIGTFSRTCSVLRWIRETMSDNTSAVSTFQRPLNCPAQSPSVVNGQIVGHARSAGMIRLVKCKPGFAVAPGGKTIHCHNGRWSKPGNCVKVSTVITQADILKNCHQPPDVDNGFIANGAMLPGTRRRVHCNDDFQLFGRQVIECGHAGTWSSPGVCKPKQEKKIRPRSSKIVDINFNTSRDGGHHNLTVNQMECWNTSVSTGYSIRYSVTYGNIGPPSGNGLYLYDGLQMSSPMIFDRIQGHSGLVFYAPRNVAKLCFKTTNATVAPAENLRVTYEPFKVVTPSRADDIVDCETLNKQGWLMDGIYFIYPRGRDFPPVRVFCDMTSFGGGWTIFQRRVDGSENFTQPWQKYKEGFGNLTRNFWLGNEALHNITMAAGFPPALYTLLIRVTTDHGDTGFVHFDKFYIEDEQDNYRIHFSDSPICNNTFVNWWSGVHNHRNFSTFDRDNDDDSTPSTNCSSALGGGGWWFNDCYSVYLNGFYGSRNDTGLSWWYFKTMNHVKAILNSTEMMVRRSKMPSC